MIGVFDYTVILTYMSLLSATIGIIICLDGVGHPFYGIFFLLLSGLCDTFDGRVARSKKNRTDREKSFGVQIDSLADLVAFGVLPACIGMSCIKANAKLTYIPHIKLLDASDERILYPIVLIFIALFYVLAAMIRLAWFNVLDEEKKHGIGHAQSGYVGLPVTSSALIFPAVMLIEFIFKKDYSIIYFVVMLITGLLFLGKFRIPKPGLKLILIMIGIGIVEFLFLILLYKHVIVLPF